MKQLLQRNLLYLYIFVSLLHLCSIIFNYDAGRFFTKPLLMPLLAITVFTTRISPVLMRNIMVIALLFSFLGDCFLLYDYINPAFFIIGLICFLLTHILYIIYFIKAPGTDPSFLKKHPIFIFIVLVYGVSLVYLLYPSLGSLKIPVMIYALVICCMMLAALNVYYRLSKNAAMYFIAGALFFIISDSMLAINKFLQSFEAASFLIMLTYCAAQYFIVNGYLLQNRK